jgi:hypothetical protein
VRLRSVVVFSARYRATRQAGRDMLNPSMCKQRRVLETGCATNNAGDDGPDTQRGERRSVWQSKRAESVVAGAVAVAVAVLTMEHDDAQAVV